MHLLQCDIEVTHDDWIEPEQLDLYQVGGFGGSDMSPGLLRLADDPEDSACIVLTDGYIDLPAAEPPYRTLWGLLGYTNDSCNPTYGQLIKREALR